MATIAIASQASLDTTNGNVTTLQTDVSGLDTSVTALDDVFSNQVSAGLSTVKTFTAINTSAGKTWDPSLSAMAYSVSGGNYIAVRSSSDPVAGLVQLTLGAGETTATGLVGSAIVSVASLTSGAVGANVYMTYGDAGATILATLTCNAAAGDIIQDGGNNIIVGTVVAGEAGAWYIQPCLPALAL